MSETVCNGGHAGGAVFTCAARDFRRRFTNLALPADADGKDDDDYDEDDETTDTGHNVGYGTR